MTRSAAAALVLLAGILVVGLSGVPRVLADFAMDEAASCLDDCDRSDGQGHCPPNCTDGPCAKVTVAVVRALVVGVAADVSFGRPMIETVDRATGRRASIDVFHPPRA